MNIKPTDQPYAVVIGLDCFTGLQTARILARNGVPVIGIAGDLHHPCARTRVCRHKFQADLRDRRLIDLLRQIAPHLNEKAVLFPCTDLTVLLISRYRDELADSYHISLPDDATIELLIDKYKFYQFAQKEGFPIPPTRFIYTRADAAAAAALRFPAILKPHLKTPDWERLGFKKVYKLNSPEHFLSIYDQISPGAEVLIIQEWIAGSDKDHYTCNCYFDRNAQPLVTFVSQKLRQWPLEGGIGCYSVECRNDIVLETSVRLFKQLKFYGLCYLEMMQDPQTGNHYIIEPNVGRPTGRSANAEAGGVALIYTMYCDCTGRPLPANRTQKYRGAKWIYLRRDLQSAAKQILRGELGIFDWLKSLRGPKYYALLSWSDPVPFFADFLHTVFKKGLPGKKAASKTLPVKQPAREAVK